MIQRRRIRDNELIDAIEAASETVFESNVWRVVRADRDPLQGSSPGGRWDDGSFDVLYTSEEADGALAEMYFHIMRGQPVFPSSMVFHLYELHVALGRALRLADMAALEGLGVDAGKYGALGFSRKHEEYRRLQEIAEAAHFLEFDGLIVPSARWNCRNIVLFTDRVQPENLKISGDHGPVDWRAWKDAKTPV